MIGGDPQTVIAILGLTMVGTASLLSLLPVGTCSQCNHCRLEQLARQRARELDTSRSYAVAFCAVCGRHHRPDEEHRT
jgi:RNase P subunit RPR2